MRCRATGLAVLLLLAPPAWAASRAAPLATLAQTLAGPGAVDLAPGAGRSPFSGPSGGVEACVTVANGKGRIRFTLQEGANLIVDALLESGQVRTWCGEALTRFTLFCEDPAAACPVNWRVDAA